MGINVFFFVFVVLLSGFSLQAQGSESCWYDKKRDKETLEVCEEGVSRFSCRLKKNSRFNEKPCPPSYLGACHKKGKSFTYLSGTAESVKYHCAHHKGVYRNKVKSQKTSLELRDISLSLHKVLEYGELQGACERYRKKGVKATRRDLLLCGKWMFFYEHFELAGAPTKLVVFLQDTFKKSFGPGSRAFGLIENPYDKNRMPLGMANAPRMENTNDDSVNWTCASCHFGQIRDGRYVVGQANHKYDYGAHMLWLAMLPTIASGIDKIDALPEKVRKTLQPGLTEWQENPRWPALASTLLSLLDQPRMPMPKEHQIFSSMWGTGVLDTFMFPPELDDRLHNPSKILSAYNIPKPEDFEKLGFAKDSPLRFTFSGYANTMKKFVKGFASLAEQNHPEVWVQRHGKPLMEYLYTLKSPKNREPLDEALVEKGSLLFKEKDCQSCHNGPYYMSMELFDFDEIGTDKTYKWLLDADKDYGLPSPNLMPSDPSEISHAIKANRLHGIWTLDRFLHNGSVGSLEELFCLEQKRPTKLVPPFSDTGHLYTCDGLSREEKLALITYLKSL